MTQALPSTLSNYSHLSSYHETVQKLRSFFFARNFIEVNTQSRLSILAACEDPQTIATFTMSGVTWPLPQTGQMWLEHELLTNPKAPGFFCLTTSYRDEPKVNPERHLKIFPLFEFEAHGDMNALQNLMSELFMFLGFGDSSTYNAGDYNEMTTKYNTDELTSDHEIQLGHDFGSIFFLKNFPLRTHPFFNMKKEGDSCKKIDAIVHGVETIGSAERSTDVEQMREMFHTISDGNYAATLYKHFGKERVDKELNEFLSHDFFPRFGGGIGVDRLIRGLALEKQQVDRIMPARSNMTGYQKNV